VGNGHTHGIYLHAMIAVDSEENTCIGLASLNSWVRTEIKKKTKGNIYRKQLIEDKESYRWIEAANQAKRVMENASEITIIADRESDIYEEWCRVPDKKTHLLTRACQNRLLSDGQKLFEHVDSLEVRSIHELDVGDKAGKRTARLAKLELRFDELEIKRPPKCTDKNPSPTVTLRVVDVRESPESIPDGEKGIHWCLLTTHEVNTIDETLLIVRWYSQRWHIEQFFRTLQKQGLDIESSQVETSAALMKLVILSCFAAIQVMQLSLAREGKDQSVSVVFNEPECKLLSKLQQKLEGKTQKQKNPHRIGMLTWAAWIIARLGGWKGYASESPPGPITMLRGLTQFKTLYEGWSLVEEMCA
jgi:Transposase DDE domain